MPHRVLRCEGLRKQFGDRVAVAGVALAMLGGAMWPLEIVGPLMRSVGHLTPHAGPWTPSST